MVDPASGALKFRLRKTMTAMEAAVIIFAIGSPNMESLSVSLLTIMALSLQMLPVSSVTFLAYRTVSSQLFTNQGHRLTLKTAIASYLKSYMALLQKAISRVTLIWSFTLLKLKLKGSNSLKQMALLHLSAALVNSLALSTHLCQLL